MQKIDGEAISVATKYGREKRIQKAHLWHHKSCGQCGHIPGYSTSIFWMMRKLGYDYHDPHDQTSCTAWNYYAERDLQPGRAGSGGRAQLCRRLRDGLFPSHPLRHLLWSLQGGAASS